MLDVACDIVIDSEIGRSYIPKSYLSEKEYNILTIERNAYKLGEKRLRDNAIKILALADHQRKCAVENIESFSTLIQFILHVFSEYFLLLQEKIISNEGYDRINKLSNFAVCKILLNVFINLILRNFKMFKLE